MATLEQSLLVAAALGLLTTLLLGVPRLGALSPAQRRAAWVVAGLALVVLAVRWTVARPSFIHANLHGTGLTEAILDFPRLSSTRATYGQFSFLTLGAIAAALGRRFEVIAAANQLFSVATLGLMAWLAARLARSSTAALWVLAVGGLHVAVVRVGASEDAHNLAMLLAAVALLSADLYAERPRRATLVVVTLAVVLMIHTRQTLYVLVPFVYLLLAARASWRALLTPGPLVSMVVVAAALIWRIAGTMSEESERTSFIVMAIIARTPGALGALLRHHPLFDVVRFGPAVPLLLLAGLAVAFSRRGPARVVGWAWLACLVISLPTGWHTPGVEFSFRLPSVMLGVVLAGLGGAWLFERTPAWWLRGLLLSSVMVLPCLLPQWTELQRESTDFQEYKHLRAQLPLLPRELELVAPPRRASRPSLESPVTTLRRAGIRVRLIEPGQPSLGVPRLLIPAIQCWGYGMAELVGFGDRSPNSVTTAELRAWLPVLFDGALDGVLAVPGQRPECQALLEGATPVGAAGQIVDAPQDIPFVLYGRGPIPLQLYLVRPAATTPASAPVPTMEP